MDNKEGQKPTSNETKERNSLLSLNVNWSQERLQQYCNYYLHEGATKYMQEFSKLNALQQKQIQNKLQIITKRNTTMVYWCTFIEKTSQLGEQGYNIDLNTNNQLKKSNSLEADNAESIQSSVKSNSASRAQRKKDKRQKKKLQEKKRREQESLSEHASEISQAQLQIIVSLKSETTTISEFEEKCWHFVTTRKDYLDLKQSRDKWSFSLKLAGKLLMAMAYFMGGIQFQAIYLFLKLCLFFIRPIYNTAREFSDKIVSTSDEAFKTLLTGVIMITIVLFGEKPAQSAKQLWNGLANQAWYFILLEAILVGCMLYYLAASSYKGFLARFLHCYRMRWISLTIRIRAYFHLCNCPKRNEEENSR